MQQIFTNIYNTNLWGNNNHSEYRGSSGGGSSVTYNTTYYIPFLKKFIIDNNASSIVDLGCGDFLCGQLIYDDINVKYIGIDIYADLIKHHQTAYRDSTKYSFVELDFSQACNFTAIPSGDICILKDVLQHWSNQYITELLDYLVKCAKFKHILIINCCDQAFDNQDIENGSTRGLSAFMYPLKKYNPTVLLNYNTKQVSYINLQNL